MEKELSTEMKVFILTSLQTCHIICFQKNKKLEDELESKNATMAELEEMNSCLRKKMEKPGHLLEIENCKFRIIHEPFNKI